MKLNLKYILIRFILCMDFIMSAIYPAPWEDTNDEKDQSKPPSVGELG